VLVSDSHRLLFVHVQKTGGSTIDNHLTATLPDVRRVDGLTRHAPLADLLDREPGLAAYWTVGFVRNPFARLLSWYRMMDRWRTAAAAGRPGPAKVIARNGFVRGALERSPDFEAFVTRAVDAFPRLRVPQVDYLCTPGRRADLIGRQETLEADLRAVSARLDLPWSGLASVNVDRSRPDYRDLYTDAMRDKVAGLYARDLAAFGYEF